MLSNQIREIIIVAVNSAVGKFVSSLYLSKESEDAYVKLNIVQSSLPLLSFQNGGFYCFEN